MIKPLDDNRYAIDFSAVNRPGLNVMQAIFGAPKAALVDGFAVGQALREVLRDCKDRDVEGRLQVWNDFRLFLNRKDYDSLRRRAPALQHQLAPALEDEVLRLKATYIGTPVLRLHADESGDVEPGHGVLQVDWNANAADGPGAKPVIGEVTVRLDKIGAAKPEGAAGSKTLRAGSALLRHSKGTAQLVAGVTYIVGRGFPNSGPEHLAITGASPRISRRQLSLQVDENKPVTATVTREAGDSNPVSVNGQSLAPGQGLRVQLPAEIVLSGELTLEIIPC